MTECGLNQKYKKNEIQAHLFSTVVFFLDLTLCLYPERGRGGIRTLVLTSAVYRWARIVCISSTGKVLFYLSYYLLLRSLFYKIMTIDFFEKQILLHSVQLGVLCFTRTWRYFPKIVLVFCHVVEMHCNTLKKEWGQIGKVKLKTPPNPNIPSYHWAGFILPLLFSSEICKFTFLIPSWFFFFFLHCCFYFSC